MNIWAKENRIEKTSAVKTWIFLYIPIFSWKCFRFDFWLHPCHMSWWPGRGNTGLARPPETRARRAEPGPAGLTIIGEWRVASISCDRESVECQLADREDVSENSPGLGILSHYNTVSICQRHGDTNISFKIPHTYTSFPFLTTARGSR